MCKFGISNDQIDELYVSLVNDERTNLFKVVRLCMILSHGKARVEAGFSRNEQKYLKLV